MKRLLSTSAILLFPACAWAGIYKCMENGRAMYSPFKSNPDCVEMSLSDSGSRNIVSPGAAGMSSDGLSLLHGARAELKRQLDSQAESAIEGGDRDRKERQAEEAAKEGRVIAGMTQDQVTEVLGEPTDVETVPGEVYKERWYYWEGTRIRHHMIFQDGSVVYYYRAP